MRRLLVVRHAKAEPGEPGGDDHDRRLTVRGRRQARALGREVAGWDDDERPALLLASSAARALDTARRLAAELPDERGSGEDGGAKGRGGKGRPEVRQESSLYGAGPDEVLALLRTVEDEVAVAAVVGHNPTVHELVLWLLEAPDGHRVVPRFPTAAAALVELDASVWGEVVPGSGRLLHLVLDAG